MAKANTKKTEDKPEVLKLERQTLEQLRLSSIKGKVGARVSVEMTDDIAKAFIKVSDKLTESYPGINPTASDLARSCLMRGAQEILKD